MAIHPSFPQSPYELLHPDYRWFPADDALRESSYEKQEILKLNNHFAGAGKMIEGGKSAVQTVNDYHLSRFACYLFSGVVFKII